MKNKTKILKFGSDARSSLLRGIQKLNDAVASTLGPGGHNVIIETGNRSSAYITKDGVTVARSITLKDPFENIGATLVKQVAGKANDDAGDGTTTATVLSEAIFRNGLKYIISGANPKLLKEGIDLGAAEAVKFIKSVSKPVSGKSDIINIGTISANGDKKIGTIIADVMDEIGQDGTIRVQDGNGLEMEKKIVKGMQLPHGYMSPYFVTNNLMECVLDNPLVLLADKKISSVNEILNILQEVSKSGRSLLMMADDFESDVISTLVMNKLRGTLKVCTVKTPSFSDNKKEILKDIAVLTGSEVFSDDTGVKLSEAKLSQLGSAKSIIVTRDTATFIEGAGDKAKLDERIAELKAQIEKVSNKYVQGMMKERLAKLTGGVGIILVGAQTEAELKEKHDRVEDAFNATKAAVEEGVIPGAGNALLFASTALRDYEQDIGSTQWLSPDVIFGIKVVEASLSAPFERICSNANIPEPLKASVMMAVKENSDMSNPGRPYDIDWGIDASAGKKVNLMESGIIDPAKVTICALNAAASIAGLMLTTDSIIADDIEQEKDSAPSMDSMA